MSSYPSTFDISVNPIPPIRMFMKGKFDAYVLTSSKLNSRPVYCSQLYSMRFCPISLINAFSHPKWPKSCSNEIKIAENGIDQIFQESFEKSQ